MVEIRKMSSRCSFVRRVLNLFLIKFIFENELSQLYVDPNIQSTLRAMFFFYYYYFGPSLWHVQEPKFFR